MLVDLQFRSAEALAQRLDSDLVIAVGQPDAFNCSFGSSCQVCQQVHDFFNGRQLGVFMDRSTIVVPELLPLTQIACVGTESVVVRRIYDAMR